MIRGAVHAAPPSVERAYRSELSVPLFHTTCTEPSGPVRASGKLCPNVVASEVPGKRSLTATGVDHVAPSSVLFEITIVVDESRLTTRFHGI